MKVFEKADPLVLLRVGDLEELASTFTKKKNVLFECGISFVIGTCPSVILF